MASSHPSRSEFSRRVAEHHHSLFHNRERPGELRGFPKFAVERQVQQLISRPMAFTYLMPNHNYTDAVEEFNKLLTYVSKCEQPGKKQLAVLIFPVFVHLYLLMLQNSTDDEEGYRNASTFFEKYKCIFLKSIGYENVLKELSGLKKASDVKKHKYFSQFWNKKCTVNASIGVLQNLKAFLEDIKSKTLVYILHFFIYFEDEDSYSFVDDEELKSESAEYDSMMMLTNVDVEAVLPSTVLPIDIDYKFSYFSAADINENETEICIASHNSSLGVENTLSSCIHIKNLDNSPREVNQIKLAKLSSVRYVPGGSDKILVTFGMNVKLMSTATGRDVFLYDTMHLNQIWSVDANKSFFVTGSKDLKACFWKLSDKVAVKEYIGHKADVTAVKLHPNGLYFATGSADTTICLWDIDKSLPIRYFNGNCGKITAITFSPDGKLIASSDSLGAIKLWDIRECAGIFEVPDVKAPCSNILFNDVNTQFAFCDDTGTFRRWDYRFLNELTNREFKKFPMVMKFNYRRQWKVALKNENL